MAENRARVYLQAEDQTKSAFESVKRNITDLDDRFVGLRSKLAGLAAGLTAGAFTAWVAGSIEAVAALDDLSEKTSLSVELLDRLSQVAEISGQNVEEIAAPVAKLAKNLSLAAEGNKEAADAFRAIGVEVKDAEGKVRAFDDVLLDVAGAISNAADKTDAIRRAQDLLGKSAAELIPFFNDLAELSRVQARVTAEQASAAEALGKEWGRLKNEATTVGVAIANGVVPPLRALLQDLRDGREAAGSFWRAISIGIVTDPFKSVSENLDQINRQLDDLATKVPAVLRLGAQLSKAVGLGDPLAGARETLEASKRFLQKKRADEVLADVQARLGSDLADPRDTMADPARKFRLAAAGVAAQAPAPDKPKAAKTGKTRELQDAEETFARLAAQQTSDETQKLESFVDSWRKANDALFVYRERLKEIDAIAARQAEFGVTAAEIDQMRLKAAEDLIDAEKRLADEKNKDAIAETRRLQSLADELKRLDPRTVYQQRVKDIDALAARAPELGLSPQQIAEAQVKAAEDLQKATGEVADQAKETSDVARELGLTFESAFERGIATGEGLRGLLKGLEQDLARIGARKLVTEPLATAATGIFGNLLKSLGGSFLGNLFGPATQAPAPVSTILPTTVLPGRAAGGLTPAGAPYMVGERGPEVVSFREPATLTPNGRGGAAPVNVNLNINAIDTRSGVEWLRQNMRYITGGVNRVMSDFASPALRGG